MTVKLYCTICGKEIPKQAEGQGWNEYIIKLQRRPWGNPHIILENAVDLSEVCVACGKSLIAVVKNQITQIKVNKR